MLTICAPTAELRSSVPAWPPAARATIGAGALRLRLRVQRDLREVREIQRHLRRGLRCRGARRLRPCTRQRCKASCGAGGSHFSFCQFGGWASDAPLQMRSWWSDRLRKKALPDPTHELAAPVVAAPELVCGAVGVATTWWPSAQYAPGSSGGRLAGVDHTFTWAALGRHGFLRTVCSKPNLSPPGC